MTGPTSARVPGHTLVSEGSVRVTTDGRWVWRSAERIGKGECSCGALSPVLDSNNARKRWHREHKGDVLASKGGPVTAPTHVVVPVEPCPYIDTFERDYCTGVEGESCMGCLGNGNGTRAVLDQAQPVTRDVRSATEQWWRGEAS